MSTLLRELDQDRVLLAAGDAPRGPDVEQPDLALHVLRARRSCPGSASCGQREGRRRLADQRRGHLARVQVESDGEQGDEGGEADQRSSSNGSCASFVSGSGCALRRDAVAAVEHGDQAAERHQHAAAPDPVDEGFVVDADGPVALRLVPVDRLAERDIDVAQRGRRRSRLRSSAWPRSGSCAFPDSSCARTCRRPPDRSHPDASHVVRALDGLHAVEGEVVAGRHRPTGRAPA